MRTNRTQRRDLNPAPVAPAATAVALLLAVVVGLAALSPSRPFQPWPPAGGFAGPTVGGPAGPSGALAGSSAGPDGSSPSGPGAPSDASGGPVTLLLGGDLLLDLAVGRTLAAEGAARTFAGWLDLRDRWGPALGFANLESPVSDVGEALSGKRYTFRAEPPAAPALREGGFEVVSLANNHALDFGTAALLDTLARLSAAGVTAVGAGADVGEAYAPRIVRAGGADLAFLAFTDTFAVPVAHREMWGAGADRPGTALLTERARVLEAVAAARGSGADIVVVSVHWGYEYVRRPAPAERALARDIIDAGADLVVGHHPHVTQGLEIYRGRLILYSLGNLLFDSEKSPDRAVAALVTFVRDPAGTWAPGECRLRAMTMDRRSLTPCPAGDAGARALLEEVADLSRALGTRVRLEGDELVVEGLASPGSEPPEEAEVGGR